MTRGLNEKIAGYINSKDIRKHLIDINFDFSTTQAAFLISQNAKLSIHEKHKEFEWLMSICEDEIVTEDVLLERKYLGPISLFKLIKEYISAEDKVLSEFYKKEENAVYIYRYRESDYGWHCGYDYVFAGVSNIFTYLEGDDSSGTLEIQKRYLNNSKESIDVIFDPKTHKALSCWANRESLEKEFDSLLTFENMWLNFPVPFKKGDIVCSVKWNGDYDLCSSPMVCDETTWGYCKKNTKYHGHDCSDMNVWGYFCWENGVMYREVSQGLLDMEYYDTSKHLGVASDVLINYSRYAKGGISKEEMLDTYKKLIRDNAEKTFFDNYDYHELSGELSED